MGFAVPVEAHGKRALLPRFSTWLRGGQSTMPMIGEPLASALSCAPVVGVAEVLLPRLTRFSLGPRSAMLDSKLPSITPRVTCRQRPLHPLLRPLLRRPTAQA